MLNEILGDYPQIKVIDYLLMNPFAELSKLQIAVGSEISRITLNNFIDNLETKELIIKKPNSKYMINLESPIIIQLNMLLDELNRISMEKAMNELDEPYMELSNEELDEIFDENSPDVDLLQLEKEIMLEEDYNVYIVEEPSNYMIIV
ncbi:MAG: hypothetical protein J6P09_05510 [Methanobrevibacter sp.]|nr:hypothetical protein [Methanobrevibacter sp.]